MCVLAFAWKVLPGVPLILAGNRDEYFARPSADCHWWRQPDGIIGGRDLEAGGGWLGINRTGRLAVVTNVREAAEKSVGDRSRGELVAGALSFQGPIRDWIRDLDGHRSEYSGFNLVICDSDEMHCLSNRGEDRRGLEPGIYGLSNSLLDTPWPKVVAVREGLRCLVNGGDVATESIFGLLSDRSPAPDEELPATGVPLEWERELSAVFIAGPDYGTRASTVVRISADGTVELEERRFGPGGQPTGVSSLEFGVSADQSGGV